MRAGNVSSVHLHPETARLPMELVPSIEAVTGKGILGCTRYFERQTRRQVTLIEREQIAEHATALGIGIIAPGVVRSNIETTGICLRDAVGKQIQVGESVLLVRELRTPCEQMDAIAPGLRELMRDGKQGVLAEVVRGGIIRAGDSIALVPAGI